MNQNRKQTIINIGIFALAILCLILTPLGAILSFFALLFVAVGVFMIARGLHIAYELFKDGINFTKDEIMLEMAVEKDGEKYVVNDSPFTKNQDRQIKNLLRGRRTTVIFSYIISACFFYLAIQTLISIF